MSIGNVGGFPPHASSFKSRPVGESRNEGGRKTAEDVLASLREMMPGWTISTTTADWTEGARNIQIDRDILQRMADDPREMEKIKSLIQGFESKVTELEAWRSENPGMSLEIGISFDAAGHMKALIRLMTQSGEERHVAFDLTGDKSSWGELMMQNINDLQSQLVAATGESKSWSATA